MALAIVVVLGMAAFGGLAVYLAYATDEVAPIAQLPDTDEAPETATVAAPRAPDAPPAGGATTDAIAVSPADDLPPETPPDEPLEDPEALDDPEDPEALEDLEALGDPEAIGDPGGLDDPEALDPEPLEPTEATEAPADPPEPSDDPLEEAAEPTRHRDVPHLIRTANYARNRGNLSEAEHNYLRALHVSPRNPRALAGLTRVAMARRDGTQAVRWARRLAEAHSSNPNNHVLLGDAYLVAGNRSAAVRAWRHALELRPGLRGAQTRLAR